MAAERPENFGRLDEDSAGVLAVVVVYNRTLSDVRCWSSLGQQLRDPRSDTPSLVHVLIYDNSPLPMAKPWMPSANVSYQHDPDNGGTRAAFQHAAVAAKSLGLGWMLLLDQDTEFPSDFFSAAGHLLSNSEEHPAAIVPRVMHGNLPVSPAVVSNAGVFRPISRSEMPRTETWVTAIASGSLVSVNAFLSLGPIPQRLWLDGVDHWIFLMLRRRKFAVGILDVELMHNLSIADIATMPPWRVVSFLDSELQLLNVLPASAKLFYPYRLFRYLLRIRACNRAAFRASQGWLWSKIIGRSNSPQRPAP